MKRRCVFLDRDGVINVAPLPGDYIRRWEDFELIPGIVDWLRLFRALGYLVIVVTNQRSIARGLVSGETIAEIHRRMRATLAARGAPLDDVWCCPHEEGTCNCRKPRPGMVQEAAAKWDIDLTASVMMGDSERDRQLAAICGLTFIQVRDGHVTAVVDRIQQS